MITLTGIVSSPSWPGVFRPSAHQRQGADGRNKPGHDGETKAYVSSYRENALAGKIDGEPCVTPAGSAGHRSPGGRPSGNLRSCWFCANDVRGKVPRRGATG